MKILIDSKIYEITKIQLYEQIGDKNPVCIDVGTGSGRFVLSKAKLNPSGFYIGLDPVPDNMKKNSLRARKLIKKTGISNLLYTIASVEAIPRELENLSDIVTVHLPWGSLRDGIILCDPVVLSSLRKLGKPGTQLFIIIGYDENNEPLEMEKCGLPVLSEQLFVNLSNKYQKAGIKMLSVSVLDNDALKSIETDWAKRLAYGSLRQMYKIDCEYI